MIDVVLDASALPDASERRTGCGRRHESGAAAVASLFGVPIRLLKADGWHLVRTKGSHQLFKHSEKPGIVTVPHPKKDIPTGTLRSIAKQAGIKLA